MSRIKYSLTKNVVFAAALAAAVSGVAHADDSSMNPFTGDSYAYFNRALSNTSADPSWRQSHPSGLSERELMALSSEAPAWQLPNNPIASYTVASTDQTNVAQSAAKPSLRDRIAKFFHVARGS